MRTSRHRCHFFVWLKSLCLVISTAVYESNLQMNCDERTCPIYAQEGRSRSANKEFAQKFFSNVTSNMW
jgi:hypothetical protein